MRNANATGAETMNTKQQVRQMTEQRVKDTRAAWEDSKRNRAPLAERATLRRAMHKAERELKAYSTYRRRA